MMIFHSCEEMIIRRYLKGVTLHLIALFCYTLFTIIHVTPTVNTNEKNVFFIEVFLV